MAHHVNDVTLSTENYTTPGDATVAVTEIPSSHIHLHEIVVRKGRGRGFGTALLQELCRYADHKGLPIVCTMIASLPDGRPLTWNAELAAQQERDERRLAYWYYRHGFRRGDLPVEQWTSPAELRREPQPHVTDGRAGTGQGAARSPLIQPEVST